MARNDIYNSKDRWEKYVKNFDNLHVIIKDRKRKYHVKNKDNIKYFYKLAKSFEVDDLSFIRRIRLVNLLKQLCFFIDKDLNDVSNEDIDDLILEIRKISSSIKSLESTQHEIKQIAKKIGIDGFNEFKIRIDKSQERARLDKINYNEFNSLVKYFSNDPTMQILISLTFECLSRPQENLFIKLKNIEWSENYAIIKKTEHGKEGLKELQSMESFPYLLKLYQKHPKRNDSESYLFLNANKKQLTVHAANKRLKIACKCLDIKKPVTLYTFKRFGVTHKRQNGVSDQEIQFTAGWTTTKQLYRTYDQSNQRDIFKIQRDRRFGNKDTIKETPKTKNCQFCGELIGFAESNCPKCLRPSDPEEIKKQANQEQKNMEKLVRAIEIMAKKLDPKSKEEVSEILR